MAKTSPALATPLREQLEKLAAFEPQPLPVISLYLNLAPNQHGRDHFDSFVRKTLTDRQRAFANDTPERASFDCDRERIATYLATEIQESANAVAIFACAGANDFFETIQVQAAIDEHWLFIGAVPHLYPLARIADQFPRYAAVVLDTYRARIVVFSLGAIERRKELTGVKTRRNSMGGWSQARYRRRAENFHLHHVKEVVETLDKIVARENILHVVIAGDDVVVPIVKEQLPQRLLDKLVDVLHLEPDIPEDALLRATLETLHERDAEDDAEAVERTLGEWQANGLGTVGPEATLEALTLGQVDELLITGTPAILKPVQQMPATATEAVPGIVQVDTSAPAGSVEEKRLKLAAELVNRAHQTAARVRFIENPQLLENFGGVAASLRFRI